ncbi:WD40 repeat-like protein, partial [Linnemannia elongata AG-77]
MSITNEPSIMQFLAERVHEDQTFKNKLHQVIELSKADSQASQAASNAISILIQAGVHFNGADLQGVRVPKADLTGGQFDSAQFQGADLTGANLTMSWIWQADFSNAQMAEVQFGELPSLQESSPVKCCAYSSNEQKFAVGLWNGKIRLYDTITWKVRVLHGHRSAVSSISFSCTGNQLISGGDDSTVQIWDPQEGKVRVRRKVLLCKATCVAFSPKDQHVALATEQYSVGIWNVKSDKDFVLRGHTAPVTSVAWSPSGHQIASGSRDGTIRLWNSETWILSLVLNSIASPASGVCCIAYSPDGRRIVAGDDNGELKLWNSMANELEHSMKGHYSTVNGVTFSKDGQWIASCSYDKSVRLWDAKAHVGVSIMNGHLNPVYDVAFSPDDLQIVSCSSDRTVRRWDVSTKGASLASHIDPGEVSIVAYSLDGQYILSGYQRLRKWDALTGASTSLRLDLPITCMAFSPSGCQIATDSGDVTSNIWSRNIWKDNDIRLWHSQTGVAEDVLCGHTDRVTSLAYSPCGRWIASSSCDKTLRLWDLHNALQVLTLKGHIGEVNAVVFSPDGLQIASGGADGTIRLWQPDTGDCTVVLKGHSRGVTAVAYSSDNLQIVSSCKAGSIRLWQVESRTSSVLHGDDEGMIWSASFSPCCKWIAATFMFARQEEDDDYEALRLWKVDESGNWLSKTVPQGLFNFVSSVAWNPFFPNQFVTGFWDRSVSVWSLAEEQDDADVSLLW